MQKDYSTWETKDLIKTKKSLTWLTMFLTALLVILAVVLIFLVIRKGFSALVAVPLALLPTVFIMSAQVKMINKELELRQDNP